MHTNVKMSRRVILSGGDEVRGWSVAPRQAQAGEVLSRSSGGEAEA